MSFIDARVVAIGAEPEKYHTVENKRGDLAFRVSSSSLRAFAECPAEWVTGVEEPDTKSTIFGSLYDCRLLTPDQFDKRYIVHPESYPAGKNHKLVKRKEIKLGAPVPWKSNAAHCEAWELLNAQDREIISPKLFANVEAAITRIKGDEILNAYIEASQKQVWVEGNWQDEPTGMIVPVRCLIDLVPTVDSEFFESVGDNKTARDLAVVQWGRAAFKMGYHIQAWWNLNLLNAATAGDRKQFCFLLQRNIAPWQTGRRMILPDMLRKAGARVKTLMARYCSCLKTGKWPDYDDNDEASEGWTIWREEPWMETQELFEPHFEYSQETETANDPTWMKAEPAAGEEATTATEEEEQENPES